jgi:CubicO group peptidase (beta-lactamase class C family)
VTPATVFDIGSITKQFTAAAILKLQMQGKLDVQTPVSDFYPFVPDEKKVMPVHQLLTHTSGLKKSLGGDYDPVTRDDFVRQALLSPPLDRPGKKFIYSDAGYSLLGAVVEKASGQSYESFLNQYLFQPAGMKQTGYRLPEWNPYDLAHGYLRGGEPWGTPLDQNWAEDGPYWHLRANGGMLSTVRDLYRWHEALKKDAILSDKAKRMFYRPHVIESAATNNYYGYGWAIYNTARGSKVVMHDGGNGIFSSDFRRYLDEDIVIIMLGNHQEHEIFDYRRQIVGIVFGQMAAPARTRTEIMERAELRETPMERHSMALLDVITSGEDAMIEDFVSQRLAPPLRDRFSPEEQLRHYQKMHEDMAGPELIDAQRTGPYGCELTVLSRQTRKHFKVVLQVEPDPPHGIEQLDVRYVE